MIIHCKNTYGDGTIKYVDYEVDDIVPESEEAESIDYINALNDLGVDTNEEN